MSTYTLYPGPIAQDCPRLVVGGRGPVVELLVVLCEQVPAKVSLEVTPDTVHVIGVALGVVVFDQE